MILAMYYLIRNFCGKQTVMDFAGVLALATKLNRWQLLGEILFYDSIAGCSKQNFI